MSPPLTPVADVAAPRPSVEAQVDALMQAAELEALAGARRIATVLGAALVVGGVVNTIRREAFTAWLCAQLAAVIVLGIALYAPRLPHRARTFGLTASVTAIALGATLHYGPTSGTGLLAVAATLAGTLFFGPRGSIVTAGAMAIGFAVLGLGERWGWLHPEMAPPDGLAFGRVVVTSTVALVWCTYLFHRIRGAFRASLEARIAASLAEEAANRERERLLRSSFAAQRLEGLGRLAGGVAHDFNNALVVIQHGVETARRDDVEGTERGEALREVDRAVARASATARQLLSFARRRPDDGRRSRPSQIVTELKKTLTHLLPETVHLRCNVEPTPEVAMDGSTLEQALFNLVVNARDAMPKGGELVLSCRHDEHAGQVLLGVRDTGSGIAPEIRDRIFEPFFTTKGELGTGLGLAMVWGAMRQHGGTVEVTSEVERGSEITLRLPALRESGSQPVVPANDVTPSIAPTRAPSRLLIVEDDDAVRASIVRLFRRTGAIVVDAPSVAAAREILANQSFDLLVSDGVLLDGTAADVLAVYRARHPSGPAIVASGYLDDERTLAGVARGDAVFIAKPFPPGELTRIAAALLAGEHVTTSAVG